MTEQGAAKAVVFDLYGTLVDFAGGLARLAPHLGDRAEPLARLWRQKQLEYSWLRTLMGRYEDFWHVTGESLDHSMAALAIDDPALRARLMETWFDLRCFPDVDPVIDTLKARRMRTAILTNAAPTMLASAMSSAGLRGRIDQALSADGAQLFKPHPAVYQLAVDALDLPPAEILFVSANGWDVAGAGAFGLRTAWINRARVAGERLPEPPGTLLEGLDGLPALLEPAA